MTDHRDAVRRRITLLDLDPTPWREVEVPLSMTFRGPHDTIQAAFLWSDSHLWEFEVTGRRYGLPSDDGFGADKVYSALTARLTKLRDGGVSEFLYTYDMGDNWEHHFKVVDLFQPPTGTRLPRFLDGRWRTPPEGVGGAPGFEQFLDTIADPSHPDHDKLLDWHGVLFDRDNLETETVIIQMAHLAAIPRPKN